MSDDVQDKRRTVAVAVIGLLLILLTAHLLLMVEISLSEGRGPGLEGESTLAILPLLILIAALLGVFFLQSRERSLRLSYQDARFAVLLVAMFLIGLMIEPMLAFPAGLAETDEAGILLVLVPIALIAALLRSHTQSSFAPAATREEE